MNNKFLITLFVAGAGILSSCNSGGLRRNPGRVYMPDMFYSRAYDAYTANPVTRNGLTSQAPVPGTIARGEALPYHLTEADTSAYNALPFPYEFSADQIKEGGRLFNIYCGICHGEKLDGNGPLYKSGKFAAMPANLVGGDYYKFLKPGMIYHTIMYGKNMMGPYSSQLGERQRWEVVAYIKQFQSQNGGAPFTMGTADSSNKAVVVATNDSVSKGEHLSDSKKSK